MLCFYITKTVKLCTDRKYEGIRNEMNDALNEWKKIEFASFCQMDCIQIDVCDGAFIPTRQKRQTVRDQLNFKGTIFNKSSKISVNVCENSNVKAGLNKVLSQIKKEKLITEFCRIGFKEEVCNCNTFDKLSVKFSSLNRKSRSLSDYMLNLVDIGTFEQPNLHHQQNHF